MRQTFFSCLGALALAVGCTGCSSAPVLLLSPTSADASPGGAPITLTATLTGSTAAIAWALSPAVGTLSATSGASVTYTPPATLDGSSAVIVTATAGGQQAQSVITLAPALTLHPALAYVQAAATPLTLTATPANAGDTVTWSLSSALGTLSATTGLSVQYLPPPTIDRETPVTVSATAGGASARAQVVITPFSSLTIAPSTAEVLEAGPALHLVGTLSHALAPITWSLSPAAGELSSTSGDSVDYTPPRTLEETATVVVTASAGNARAYLVITAQPLPELTVSPAQLSLQPEAGPVVLAATLRHSTAPITWSLSPAVGSLSPSTGASVIYTPPASVGTATRVTVTASAVGQSADVVIDLDPQALLAVSPATVSLAGSSPPLALTAGLHNLTGTVTWSLSPALGSLSATTGATVLYTPPGDVPSATDVTVYALVGNRVAQAVLTLTPALQLTVSPVVARVSVGDAALVLNATLLHSTAPITWTLSAGAPGSISTLTGGTTLYTPPVTMGLPATVVITAAAAGLTAQATLTVGPKLGADAPPLINRRFVPFSRVTEYLVLGTSPDGTQNDQFVIDPYRAYGKVDDQPISLPPGVTAPNHAQLHRSLNPDLVIANRKVARAGNLDDDFVDETVVLSWVPGSATLSTAKLSILDASLSVTDPAADPVLTTVVPPGLSLLVEAGQTNTDYDLAVADVDGDGYDEILVVGSVLYSAQTATAVHFGKLWVFDDLAHGTALLKTLELKGDLGTTFRGVTKVKVVAGSMKNDRSAQVIIGWFDAAAYAAMLGSYPSAHLNPGLGAFSWAVFNGADFTQVGTNHKTSTGLSTSHYDGLTNQDLFNLALADVDGDQLKELVVAGYNSGWWHDSSVPNAWMTVQIFDDLEHLDPSANPVSLVGPVNDPHPDQDLSWGMLNSYPERFLVPIDHDGDHVEELLVGPYPGHFTRAVGATPATLTWDPGLLFLATNSYAASNWHYHYSVADVGAGDVNGDLRQDILVLSKSGQVRAWGQRDHLVSVSGTPLQKNYAATPDFVLLDTSGTLTTSTADGNPFTAVLVPVNVDNDSMLLEYLANASPRPLALLPGALVAHSMIYGDNKLIALLAAPPVTDGLGQNNGNDATTFGTTTSGTFGTGATFATRAGVVVGAEFELSAGLGVNVTTFKLEIEIASQLEYTHSNSWSRTVSQSVSDSAGDGQDLVIFSTTPYDRYTYLVASNPNPSLVGTTITVDVPRTTQVMSVSRPTYNAIYSNGLLITADLLQDTPYELSSYPTRAQVRTTTATSMVDIGHGLHMASTIVPFGQLGPYNISEGNNGKSCELGISQDQAWQDGVTYSLDFSAKVAVMGVMAGVTGGFSSGGYLERSTSNGIVFAGSVWGLPTAQFTTVNQYSWGLHAYKQTLRDDQGKVAQDFFVVNYWKGAYGAP